MSFDDLEVEQSQKDNLAVGAKGGAIAFILKISATALVFLNQVILARILGAGGLGEIILAISVAKISAQIAKFGMEETMMRFVPLYIDQEDNARLKSTIYFALKFSFLLSVVFVFLMLLLSEIISINIFHSKMLLKLLPIVAIAVPASVVRDIVGGILKGYKDTFRALLPELLISPSLRIVVFLLLVIRGVSPLYAIVAYVAGEIVSVLLSIKFLSIKIKNLGSVKLHSEKKKVLDVAYTIIITGMSLMLYSQVDIWVLGIFMTTETVGVYGVAGRLVLLLYFPMFAFATIISPLLSSAHASGNLTEVRRITRESSRWILSMAMPIILVLILEGKFVLKYFFGWEFEAGYTVLLILTVGHLINTGSGLVGVLFQMTGEHKVFMKINIFFAMLNLILNIILVPSFGMVGAAIATTFCLSMMIIISVFVIYKRLSVLTLPKDLKFDVAFVVIVTILYFLCQYNNFYFGYHILLIGALTVYIWKSIANDDLPWRILLAKNIEGNHVQ